MFNWRNMSPQERQTTLELRKSKHRPWHSPPHRYLPGARRYLISAAIYEHEPTIAYTAERMDEFSEMLLYSCQAHAMKIHAWCVMPDHYHVLVRSDDLRSLLHSLALLHGRTSFTWNQEETRRGRRVWCNYVDREMRSEKHFWSTLNYVHHNPVKHGFVERWQDWPWSSAEAYLESMGWDRAANVWRNYPVPNGDPWTGFENP
jgi:putative transposase